MTEQPNLCPDCGNPKYHYGVDMSDMRVRWCFVGTIDEDSSHVYACNQATIARLRSQLSASSLVIEAADRLRDEVGAVKSVPGALSKAALAYDDARRKHGETAT